MLYVDCIAKLRTYLNIMIVFLISGLWHGANWTFVIWGALHGLFSVLNRLFKNQWEKLHIVTRWTLNFVLINALWVLFRSESLGHALYFLRNMFSMNGGAVDPEVIAAFPQEALYALSVLPVLKSLLWKIINFPMWFYLGISFFIVLNVKNCSRREFKLNFATAAVTCVCLVLSIMSFAGVTEFLYFNF